MEYEVLGWPADGPTLHLDWQTFSYAGKFVMSNTGKAVLRDQGAVVAAVAFNEDRTDPATVWLRYITVTADRRGDGLGPRLARFATDEIFEEGYETVKIAVNNPFAYEALYKAGFSFTGTETGIAELVLASPRPADGTTYRTGLRRYADRDLSAAESGFVRRKLDRGTPPARLENIR